MWSLVTVAEANPSPNPSKCQSSFGPAVGHVFNKPEAGYMPLRLGPRHWDISCDDTVQITTAQNTRKRKRAFMEIVLEIEYQKYNFGD
jgi:predicted sugar kinase